MKNPRIGPSFVGRAICAALALLVFPAIATDKPNVLVIVANDLGFEDVGFNGGTIPTHILLQGSRGLQGAEGLDHHRLTAGNSG